MSPFKEPQPRKVSDADLIAGSPRVAAEKLAESMRSPENAQTPLMVIPDHTQFQLRKAALEAACAWALTERGEATSAQTVIKAAGVFEEYLRDGTKPQ
jgi:hypothetical protein